MAIPELSADGWLPPGIHSCTIDEVLQRFGRFNKSDQRVRLAGQLRAYFDELLAAEIATALLVDGSYVTDKPEPNDVDLIVILRDEVADAVSVPPFKYNPRSKKYVRKTYGFDMFWCFTGSSELDEMVKLFCQVKNQPGAAKGLLRVVT